MSAAVATPRTPVQRRALTREEFDRFSPVVRRTAMWVGRRAPRHVTVSDLCAKGWIGLLDAITSAEAMSTLDSFDEYASVRIRGAMFDYLSSFDDKLREARKKSRLLARTIAALESALQRPPEEQEISAALSMSAVDYDALLASLAAAGAARLELLDFDAEGSFFSAGGTEIEPTTLEVALARLPLLSQQVVALLHQEEATPAEAAEVLGIDVGRVQRIHTEAMHRLRASLGRE